MEFLQELHVGTWIGMTVLLLICVFVFWQMRDRG